jgi:hypothetical protein
MHETFRSTDQYLKPTERAYVVYDKATGNVIHVHRCVTFPHTQHGAEAPEERARRIAGEKGRTAGVLETDPAEVELGDPIKVDCTNLKVVRTKAKPV